GEKVGIIESSHDPTTFVARELSPAKVSSVTVGEDTGEAPPAALVIVPDNQLSLAIGKKGQNARLAAKLTGMRIDIKSESEVESERAAGEGLPPVDRAALMALPGVSPGLGEPLGAAGRGAPAALVKAGPGKLGLVPEVGGHADAIHAAAVGWVAAHTPAPEPRRA